MPNNYLIAYVSRLMLPASTANAIQTVNMAAALSREAGRVGLFVHDARRAEPGSGNGATSSGQNFRIWRLGARFWPSPIYRSGRLRFLFYNSALALLLLLHPSWRSGAQKLIFVRSRLEFLYWGILRRYLRPFRNWRFVFEAHDLQVPLLSRNPWKPDFGSGATRRVLRALCGYDLVVAVNRALADDISRLTGGRVDPAVLPLCSDLPRVDQPAIGPRNENRIKLGYFGTLDEAHGVDDLLDALRLLSGRFVLCLAGRLDDKLRRRLERRSGSLGGRVKYLGLLERSEVAAEMDACDILLAPSGSILHSERYRSPLKVFDYMTRGRPIVAAGVPCHRELLRDSVTAMFYSPGDAEDLAGCLATLVNQPDLWRRLARNAWEEAPSHTYELRARQMLALFDERLLKHRAEEVEAARSGDRRPAATGGVL